MNIYLFFVVILIGLAIFDLVVGVSNDAVNFLNSSIGSKVAPRHIILIIASLGMLFGVTFSSGMMEVARKGIFHPKLFIMPELIFIFLAVMFTDILLLDLFNTFGLPTSTTVSIVFELLGAAVAISLIKIYNAGDSFATIINYINTAKALAIISGILLSVIIAFFFGALVQFIVRLVMTFDYKLQLKRYGGLWGGVALSSITYFILIKGSKGASFLTPETVTWIHTHTLLILFVNFIIFTILFQILSSFTRLNILKPIVLSGTFALAMAFAANDLVNFIGVPLAGLNAYKIAWASNDPMNILMAAMQKKFQTNTYLLLIAGSIMVITLWLSRKARTVSQTELSLGRQDEGMERFGSSAISRVIVRMVYFHFNLIRSLLPAALRRFISNRLDSSTYKLQPAFDGKLPSFDLVRASVNLVVASAVISFATSLKLPLSTTYVTFMVSMGSSLADQAWGRESAVYRVTGVLTVIGGWFFTAMIAFSIALIFASFLYIFKFSAVIILLLLACFLMLRSSQLHGKRTEDVKSIEVFSLKNITHAKEAIRTSFEHTGYFLEKVSQNLDAAFDAMMSEDRQRLNNIRSDTKKVQQWANSIIANIFKTLFLLHKEDVRNTQKYAGTIRALQTIVESHRDVILRASIHINNNHKGFHENQKEELRKLKTYTNRLIENTAIMLLRRKKVDYDYVESQFHRLNKVASEIDKNQILRIQNSDSKVVLSILFYAFLNNSLTMAEQTRNLVDIFKDSFSLEDGHDGERKCYLK